MSTYDIAKIKGVSPSGVSYAMKKLGIASRTRSEFMNLCYSNGKIQQLKGSNSLSWKGGRTHDGKGYILVYAPNHPRASGGANKYVFEHILVWEKFHGKPLPKNFIVHHLNGVKDDNRPENLVAILQPQHDTHTKVKLLQKRIRQLENRLHDLLKSELPRSHNSKEF